MAIKHPFTAEDKKAIEEAIKTLDDLMPILVKTKNCGVECDEYEKRINNNRKRLNAFLNQFWPDTSI